MKKISKSCIGLLMCLFFSTLNAQFNYGEALQKSLLFYEVQQSGKLPDWNRVSWRGDSTMEDGSDVGLDLNGGWFDAGDHVKFNFPMAFSVTSLAWGGIEFEDAYRASGQLDILKRNLRFVTDYFIKCHTAPNELYGQVGNGGIDHGWWGSPEVYPRERPSYKIDEANPGSDLAAETAAAMAAVSILLKNDDPAYSAMLVAHAKELYDFADKFRDEYSNSITDAAGFYRSFSSYNDEIVWGAIWMYKATNDPQYLTKAESEYDNLQKEGQSTTAKYKEAFSWDDKAYGCYLLLAQITGKDRYIQDIERNLDYFAHNVNGESVPTTPGGLPHLRPWGTIRYSSNQSLLALIYADKVATDPVKQARYTGFAKRMVDYALGDNPINRSFMNGFGNNPANDPHHRGNSGNWTNSDSGPPTAASHILYGAVVGGPKEPGNDNFIDDRGEFIANEVACDYNACITGVLARMYGKFGGNPLANFPVPKVPSRAEIRSFSKFNSNNAFGTTISINVQNRTAWPARVTDKLSYRYYFDIAEGIAAGNTIADYNISLNGIGGAAKMTIKPAGGSVYYAEITNLPSISPIGDPAFRTETQINIRVANGVPYNTTNDWSAQGLAGGAVESVNIPVYDNGILVFGKEPDGGNTPTASFTATPESGIAPLDVQFDASTSSDPNGDALSYNWNFGNGQTSSVVDPLITYSQTGSYLVTLTVSDGQNISSEFSKTITVSDGNIAPVANFTATPTTGIAPVTVSFDATTSTDENGDTLTYTWDFGDGTTGAGVTVDHQYATVGEYIATLTVSDGAKEDTKTQTITVTDGSPIAAFTASADSGITPLDVTFDASGSSDPAGENLTYAWDFGNGSTATTATASTTYTVIGSYVVTLTVTNTSGKTDSDTKTINVTDGSTSCAFGTPTADALPTINSAFENIYVLGNGGPNLDNVTNFTINWDLANNGLYQFSMNTSDGNPSYWNDFLPKVTQKFNAAEPEVTITGSGFTGLDGDYWATVDAGNFVLVSKTGGFTIYFSTTATAPDCGVTTPVVDGGVIAGGPFEFTVGDGIADNVSGVTLTGTIGETNQWVITDATGKILGLPPTPEAVDFDSAGVGSCFIYNVTYNGTLTGLATDGLISALSGDFDLSNSIEVVRNPVVIPPTVDGGVIAGGPFVFTVGDGIADNVSGVTLTGTVGETSQWIITDAAGKILGLPLTPEAVDFDGAGVGSCFIYNVTYNGAITGLVADQNISALAGEFDLSNSIEVVRNPVSTGGDCSFGTPATNALPSVNSAFENIYILGTGGPNLDNVTKFTINWDLANNGLYQFSMNTSNGTPDWYVDFLPKVTQNFNAAQPEITITGSGFTGLDGAYWATVDAGNFVLVSKTGGFTLYFSTLTTAPDCGGGTVNTPPVANISATPISGEAPLVVTFDASTSTDTDGDTLTYSWDFGDSTSGSGVTAENTYTAIGEYEVTLTVADGNGGEDIAKITIKATDGGVVINPPTGDNAYINRFIEMRNEIYDPANGYFSADGSPHHSIETLIVEAPDYGHESTSELYSYWLWLEVMNGRITGDWTPLSNVWDKIEQFIIPTKADQPSNAAYNPSSPAAYASEFPLPSNYPAPLEFSAPVGSDPVSPDLTAAYGADIYQMHWLLDNDNFYGFGNRGDGVSTPSYINTFQRGEQESVYETIPHPSWESFDWGGTNGFLPLFIDDQSYARQWRYTSAPDADARAVQAMYWAQIYAKEQGASLGNLNLDKATKMGDFLRLSMFDKYFKPLGVQSATSGAGSGYNSAHYLMSWYMSWGGSADPASQWAFRISSSHCHFGYQNPIAAYAMSQVNEFEPKSQNGKRDWTESLKRQMEFYTWLQSKEGAIAGGATNSWNGDYSPYPAGKSTFYDMAFDTNPVYHDPGSGTWFGWQAWSMERVAEYYYITNDAMAKNLMDKWVDWVKSEVRLIGAGDFEIPATLEWTGEPDTWNPNSPGTNSSLSVRVVNYSQDLGVAASMAKALIYYAAATEKHAILDTDARDLAKEVLDRMWNTYRDDKGVSSPEDRGDYKRIFEEEVYVPQGFTGTMANGDVIQPGVSFLDIRSDLKNDPDYSRLKTAYDASTDFTQRYHRTWAQMEVALANAEYGFFFGNEATTPVATVANLVGLSISPNPASSGFINVSVKGMKNLNGKSTAINGSNVSIRLINLSGNVVRTKDIKNRKQIQVRISVNGLPSGIYVLEIMDYVTQEVTRRKVVIN